MIDRFRNEIIHAYYKTTRFGFIVVIGSNNDDFLEMSGSIETEVL